VSSPSQSMVLPRAGELLVELLSEEIPAGMQARAISELTQLFRDKLRGAEIPAERVRGYATPRRLAVVAEGIPSTQPDRTEERRGPRIGAPTAAIDGFLRSAGIASVEQCEIRDTGRGEFYFAIVKRLGRPAAEVLPDLVMAAIAELPWPKSMRYPASSLRWVRPLISVVCLFDGVVLPLAFDKVVVGRATRGHRFLSPGEICVGNAGEYLERLQDADVVLDQEQRKETILKHLDQVARVEGFALRRDPALLDEVAGLVEFPVVLAGAIEAEFMTLPPEVLATAMRTHQRYFSCLQSDGRLAPRFLFVADNLASDGGKTIIAGNERVLRARLADARFFWDQDRRAKLSSRIEALADRVFHARLGSLHDKAFRMDNLADFLVPVARADENLAKRAIFLAKADLSSTMVGEFPELQGVMGRYYALHDGEDPRVADAIVEHYKPLGPEDGCPTAPESVVVALTDKIDTLAGFFAIGEKPTGSRDPFALRRAALGAIRIILENNLRIPLHDLFLKAANIVREQSKVKAFDPKVVANDLFNFIVDRLNIHLHSQGFPYGVIEVAFRRGDLPADPPIRTVDGLEQDFTRLVRRVRALHRFLESDDGANLLVACRRAANIVAIEEKKDGPHVGPVSRLDEPEEQALAAKLEAVAARAGTFLEREQFEEAMAELAQLRLPIDTFFEKITVNADDGRLRENRLRLLSRVRATFDQVADFSQIEG
jgi:glycyl-tRNA synthetase beta chain